MDNNAYTSLHPDWKWPECNILLKKKLFYISVSTSKNMINCHSWCWLPGHACSLQAWVWSTSEPWSHNLSHPARQDRDLVLWPPPHDSEQADQPDQFVNCKADWNFYVLYHRIIWIYLFPWAWDQQCIRHSLDDHKRQEPNWIEFLGRMASQQFGSTWYSLTHVCNAYHYIADGQHWLNYFN